MKALSFVVRFDQQKTYMRRIFDHYDFVNSTLKYVVGIQLLAEMLLLISESNKTILSCQCNRTKEKNPKN